MKYELLRTRCLQAMSSDDVDQWRNVSVEPQMLLNLIEEIEASEVAFAGALDQMKRKDEEIQGLKDVQRGFEFALSRVPVPGRGPDRNFDLSMRLEDWHRVKKMDAMAFKLPEDTTQAASFQKRYFEELSAHSTTIVEIAKCLRVDDLEGIKKILLGRGLAEHEL